MVQSRRVDRDTRKRGRAGGTSFIEEPLSSVMSIAETE